MGEVIRESRTAWAWIVAQSVPDSDVLNFSLVNFITLLLAWRTEFPNFLDQTGHHAARFQLADRRSIGCWFCLFPGNLRFRNRRDRNHLQITIQVHVDHQSESWLDLRLPVCVAGELELPALDHN